MACRNAQVQAELYEDYVSGLLPAQQATEVERHLSECGDCRMYVSEARQSGVMLRAAFQPAPAASVAFWTRLRASVREQESRMANDFWGAVEQLAWRLSFGAAALVMLLVGIVIGSKLPQPAPGGGEGSAMQAESRDIFPEPVRQAVDSNDVLLELAAGRSRNGR